jgi:predicted dinucleotide-binding enzyme
MHGGAGRSLAGSLRFRSSRMAGRRISFVLPGWVDFQPPREPSSADVAMADADAQLQYPERRQTMDIAIIGAGNVGEALAVNWRSKGHTVRVGVRAPDSPDHAALRQAGVTVQTPRDAAAAAAVVVLAVPYEALASVAADCDGLAGKIVIDCTNPLRFANGQLSLTIGHSTSGGEQFAALVPKAKVYKSLNQTAAENMAAPVVDGRASVMFVAGPDELAKDTVLKLVADLGFEAVYAGGIEVSRLLEAQAMLWIHLAINRKGGRDFAFAMLRR